MQTTTNIIHARQFADGSRARALIRFNALLFHGVAAASFLESVAPLYANRLTRALADDPDAANWVDGVWLAQREARGVDLRTYIEATWPEFDWASAYEHFCGVYRQRPGRAIDYAHPALEAVTRCTIESQAALFYRAIASSADDPALRELAERAANEHVGCFAYFKSFYGRCVRRKRVGFAAACRVALETSRAARDIDVATAFRALAANWCGTPTVAEMSYRDFLKRMARLIARHAELGCFEHLLFSPWLRRARPVLLLEAGRREAGSSLPLALKAAA